MTNPAKLESGSWYRFSRYVVEDGYIRPAPDAVLETYDVWEQHREALLKKQPTTAYRELISILHRIRSKETGNWRRALLHKAEDGKVTVHPRAGIALLPLEFWDLSGPPPHAPWPFPVDRAAEQPKLLANLRRSAPLHADAARLIAEWCSEYGLLGILPHMAQVVVLPPYWTVFPPESGPPTTWTEPGCFGVANRTRLMRIGGVWNVTWETTDVTRGPNPPYRPTDGDSASIYPVERARWTRKAFPRVHLTGFEPPLYRENAFRVERLTKTWTRYFPRIPKRLDQYIKFPSPDSAEFWRMYEEPFEEFLQAAVRVMCTIEALAASPDEREDPSAPGMSTERLNESVRHLLAPVGLSVDFDKDGRVTEQWHHPSLLSCLMKLALRDLTTGYRLMKCASPTCPEPLLTDAYQAKYCSMTCHWREAKRRAREAKKGDEECQNAETVKAASTK